MKECFSPEAAFPGDFSQTLRSRHKIIKKIREFFDKRGYLEVETPIRVRCPGIEPYIDALPAGEGFFLASSPELQMKRLLCSKVDRIYQITRAFRMEEEGHLHSPEFTMLEWYRAGTDYLGIMDETEELIRAVVEDADYKTVSWHFPFERIRVDDLYEKKAGWRPSQSWDEDRYFSDWAEKIEPFLYSLKGFFLIDFPAPISSLSRIKEENPLLCERFELFMNGIEIANAFTELTDYEENVSRFEKARMKRKEMGKDIYPVDEGFLRSLNSGIPDCGGIAVGIDRLLMAVLGLNNIDFVQTFPMSRL